MKPIEWQCGIEFAGVLTAGIPNLHSSLTDVHRDDFAHLHFGSGKRGEEISCLCVEFVQTAGTYSIEEKRCEESEDGGGGGQR